MNCILTIGATHERAMQAGTALNEMIVTSKAAGNTNGVMVATCGLSVQEMRDLLNRSDAPPLPDFIQQTERKLIVTFDSEGSDLLAEISATIQHSPELTRWAQSIRLEILQMSEVVLRHCRQHQLTKVWLQPPVTGGFDPNLGQRLAAAGLETCQIDPMVEKYAGMRAIRAACKEELSPGSGVSEAAKFWSILDPEFEKLSVQAAFTTGALVVLVNQRQSSGKQPAALDTDLMYADAVLTWTEQPQ